MTGPVGLMCLSAVLAALGWLVVKATSWDYAWWIALPIWVLAVGHSSAGVKLLRHRQGLFLRMTPDMFSFGRKTVHRSQVTSVQRYKDLHFKGVRVDLAADEVIPISATHHAPRRVMDAFRKLGYPVS